MADPEKIPKANVAKAEDKKPESGAKGASGAAPTPQAPGEEKRFEGFLAEVVGVELHRTGIYGEIKQAMCKIMEGRDKGRVIRRNFAGRIKKGDLIRLPDTSREDKRIVAK
jgi:small subunit ribosomal protein S28e